VHNGGEANFLHEIGHYLDLDHPDKDNDPATLNDPMRKGASERASSHFSAEQGETMRDHCMMRRPCP
jgi:predicted HD phosphohydrolase